MLPFPAFRTWPKIFEKGSLAKFNRFLSISTGSCAELRTQLYIAFDVGYLEKQSFESLMTQAIEVGNIIGGLRAAVERKRRKEIGIANQVADASYSTNTQHSVLCILK